MVESCVKYKGILSKEEIDDILKEHEGYFIEGLSFSDQRSVVKGISNKLYRETISGNAVDIVKSKEEFVDLVNKVKKEYEDTKDFEISEGADQDTIDSIQSMIDKMSILEDNVETLFIHAKDVLDTLKGIVTKSMQDSTIEGTIDKGEDNVDDSTIERATFSDNFYLELDSKGTMSGELRQFLSFIPASEYDRRGNKVAITNILGEEEYLDFDYSTSELHRLLVGTKPNKEQILNKLKAARDIANETNNNNLAWLDAFITQFEGTEEKEFKDKTISDQVTKQFISEMTKHQIKMRFVLYNKTWNKKTKTWEYNIVLKDDNSGAKEARLKDLWKREHSRSIIVKDGVYQKDKIQEILDSYLDIINPEKDYSNVDKANRTYSILTQLGILVNKDYWNKIIIGQGTVYIKDRNTVGPEIISEGRIFHELLTTLLKSESIDATDIFTDNFIKGLAKGSAEYEADEFSNSFRVADKTIYTYSMNQYLINRIRDLKEDEILRGSLSDVNTLFTSKSLYLSLLNNTKSDFKQWFDQYYVSINPLKKNRGKRTDSITETGELDHEVTKIGYFNTGKTYETITVNGREYRARKSNFFFPTNSDKSRIMSMSGVAVESTDNEVFTIDAKRLFYETVLEPEMDRIYASTRDNFDDSVNLDSYNGNYFYLIPELNNVEIPNEDGVTTINLLELVKNTPSSDISDFHKKKIRNAIGTILNKEVKKKLDVWEQLGISNNNTISHVDLTKKSNETVRTLKETAMDMVYNYYLFNANMFQLVVGDPAQYYPNKANKYTDVKTKIAMTYANIGKRLAAEIAPGIEMEGKDYLQIFAKDIEVESSSIEYLEKIFKDNPKALADYKKMKSTDAQEYTTWKEHLNILLSLGRISQTEYDKASKAFSAGKEPSKKVFDKVLQPLKPVYVNNEVVEIGNRKMDKKVYIKSSSFPLIPTLTRGLQIDKLRLEMEALESNSGKYKGHNPEEKGVRLAYHTAVKVGQPKQSLKLNKDNKGNFVDDIDLRGNFTTLRRAGFRIQQDVPYDEDKSTVNKGTQESKLIWANFFPEDLSSEELHRRTELKKEYTNLYHKLYIHGRDKLEERLFTDGIVDNKKLSEILIEELRSKGENNKPLYDGLKIDELTGNFVVPLWLSPYADSYSSLINSIVKNSIVSHKLPGKSMILGSEAGFKTWEEYVNENPKNAYGIVYSDSYDPTKGLQGQREENGVIKGAQILIPFKFRDNQGKLLRAKDFVKDGKIDTTKLPKELLELFGFRIPTQLHASMVDIEIVGFLPHSSGDLIVAPADFTVQMGSDFDVDKLYTYMYSTHYDTETKTLSKKQEVKDYAERKAKFKSNLLEGIKQDITEEQLDEDYLAGIHNRLLNIHHEVMRTRSLQESIHSPLGMGLYRDIINRLEENDTSELEALISDEYQKKKFFDGTSGKNGVGLFSIDSVFNALAQNKGLVLQEELINELGKSYRVPISVKFGTKYNKSNGELSRLRSNKKENPRYKTEVVAAAQNLSVDNANEQGMYKINMNTYTFPVYSLLNLLGFEEDISASFMSQPIIKDYVKGMITSKSILKDYDPDEENKLVQSLIDKYTTTEVKGKKVKDYDSEVDGTLADFDGVDASETMFALIKEGENHKNFGKYQAAILEKFMQLKEYEKSMSPIKQLLNVDSKGFDKNMYINKKRQQTFYNMNKSMVLNATELFGEYITDENNNTISITPNTTAGFDMILGNDTLLEHFGNYFIESNDSLRFGDIVTSVEKITRTGGSELSADQIVKLKQQYKNYLLSNINEENVDNVRKELFTNTKQGSLLQDIRIFKETKQGKNNKFINSLEVYYEDGYVHIDYNNGGGDNFDESALYKSFIDLFRDSNSRNGVVPSDLVQRLILYSLLRGGNKSDQFIKFIPITALKKLINVPDSNFNIEVFVKQWVKHHIEQVKLVKDYTRTDAITIQVTDVLPEFIKIAVKDENDKEEEILYRKVPNTTGTYRSQNTLGTKAMDEYSPVDKVNSILKDNQVRNITEPSPNKNPLEKGYIEDVQELPKAEVKTTSITIQEKLKFDSLTNLISSIANLDEFEESKIAKAILPFVSNDVSVVVNNEERTSFFNNESNTITLTNKNVQTGQEFIINTLHEVIHSMSNKFILAYEYNKDVDPKMLEVITRLNGFRKNVINELNSKKEEDGLSKLEKFFIRYTVKTDRGRIERMLLRRSIKDSTISGIIQRTLRHLDGVEVDSALAKVLETGNAISKENFLFYSLFNLSEFVAVAGSFNDVRELMMKTTGGKYIDKIKDFFREVFKLLGIDNEETQKFLDDIFTVSGIKEETEPSSIYTVYQGYDVLDDRPFNYWALHKIEAADYGKNIRSRTIDTSKFLKKHDKQGWTKEFVQIWQEFKNKTGQYFDILMNSPEGLKMQNEFFEFARSKGYEGYSELSPGMTSDENNYFVTFEPVQKQNPVKFTNYSGAAKGSDTVWEQVGKEFGIGKQINYTTTTLDKLTSEQLKEVEVAYKEAVKELGRKELDKYTYAGKLVRRDYLQAKAADSIFAIVEGFDIVPDKSKPVNLFDPTKSKQVYKFLPKGGTGYAIVMADRLGKPINVFSQKDNKWYRYKGGQLTEINTPVLTTKYAGIGTREINEIGKQAIRNVYETTFKKEIKVEPTPSKLTDRGNIPMQPDNIAQIKAGTKTQTIRTEDFTEGIYTMPDGTKIELTKKFPNKIKAKDIYNKDEFAKAEGFKDWNDFVQTNKFSSNFINGTQSRWVYNVKPVQEVQSVQQLEELSLLDINELSKEAIKEIISLPINGFENGLWYYFYKKALEYRPELANSIKNAKDFHTAYLIGADRTIAFNKGKASTTGIQDPNQKVWKDIVPELLDNYGKRNATQPSNVKYFSEYGTFYKFELSNEDQPISGEFKQSVNGTWKTLSNRILKEKYHSLSFDNKEVTFEETEGKKKIETSILQGTNTFEFSNGIKINTGNIVVNEQQKEALNALAEFYTNDTSTFALKGYAGTGKTTILRLFQEYIKQQNNILSKENKYSKIQKVRFTSPTHRANAVIKQNTGEKVYTLHSLFGLSPEMDLEEFDASKAKFSRNNEEKLMSADILIIDESSMINNSLYDFIKDGAKRLNVKVLFVGDPKQLKPVKQTTLSKAFSEVDNSYELTKVMRTGDTPLLKEITDIRNDKNFSYETKVSDKGGVIYTNNKRDFIIEALKLFKSDKIKENPFLVRILSGLNKNVQDLNKTIREFVYGKEASNQYNEGELLVGFDNFGKDNRTGEPMIVNSGDYKVVEVSPEYDSTIQGIPVKRINIAVEDIFEKDKNLKVKKLEVLSKNNSAETFNKLGDKFEELRQYAITESAKGNKKAWIPFYTFKNDLATPVEIKYKDKPVIKKTIDYGYAMTIHKSQGGTYENVFIEADGIESFPDGEQKQQLKYVALSRASKVAVVLSNKSEQVNISSLMNKIENTKDIDETFYTESIKTNPFQELEQIGRKMMEECKGKTSTPKAKDGMKTSFTKGFKWEIVKDLKGATHAEGGIDLSIVDGKVHFAKGESKYHAKYGMVVPNKEYLVENPKNSTFTLEEGGFVPRDKREKLYSDSWTLITDLQGESHEKGGIGLDITDGKVRFTKGEAKIHAKCGCLIKANKGVVLERNDDGMVTKKTKYGRK